MKGRWTMHFSPRGYATSPLSVGAIEMPVVPCDDAAIERAARVIYGDVFVEADLTVYPPVGVPWEEASQGARNASVTLAMKALGAAAEAVS